MAPWKWTREALWLWHYGTMALWHYGTMGPVLLLQPVRGPEGQGKGRGSLAPRHSRRPPAPGSRRAQRDPSCFSSLFEAPRARARAGPPAPPARPPSLPHGALRTPAGLPLTGATRHLHHRPPAPPALPPRLPRSAPRPPAGLPPTGGDLPPAPPATCTTSHLHHRPATCTTAHWLRA